jgi:GNAT superfamily N-acetyltransferase
MTPATANFEGCAVRALDEDDLEGAVALSAEAGWNQTADDWRLLIHGAHTFGVESSAGRLIASALAHVYENRVAWIAMVLVTAGWRRKGIATELMRRCIARCEAAGLITGLDATPAGREVYRPLGFRDIYRFTRLENSAETPPPPGAGVRPIDAGDIDRVVAYDRTASGMDRRALIQNLWRRCPRHAFLVEREGEIRGIVLARDGRRAYQLGPLQADDGVTALELARAALGRVESPVFVDVLDDKTGIREFFEGVGFREQRGYTRMLLGRSEPLDAVDKIFAVAGPELG